MQGATKTKGDTKTGTMSDARQAIQKKLARLDATRRERGVAERYYEYSYTDTFFNYVLRGDQGTYMEKYGGFEIRGVLTYISNDPITYSDVKYNGYRYKGVDQTGEYYYFFGSEVSGGDDPGYVVALFADAGYELIMFFIPNFARDE